MSRTPGTVWRCTSLAWCRTSCVSLAQRTRLYRSVDHMDTQCKVVFTGLLLYSADKWGQGCTAAPPPLAALTHTISGIRVYQIMQRRYCTWSHSFFIFDHLVCCRKSSIYFPVSIIRKEFPSEKINYFCTHRTTINKNDCASFSLLVFFISQFGR
jgi:hypothetical protein